MRNNITITAKAKPNFMRLGRRIKMIGENAQTSNDFNIGEFLEFYPAAYVDEIAAMKQLAKDYPKKIYSQIENLTSQQIRALQSGAQMEIVYCGVPTCISIDDLEVRYDANTSDGSGVVVSTSPTGLMIALTTDVTEENRRDGDVATLCRWVNDARRSAGLIRGESAKCQMVADAATRALLLDEKLRQTIGQKCGLVSVNVATSLPELSDGWHISNHSGVGEEDDVHIQRAVIALARV